MTVSGVVGGTAGVTSINGMIGVVTLNLSDLPTVDFSTAPVTGQYMTYDGTNWTPSSLTVSNLRGINLTGGITNGQILRWDASSGSFLPSDDQTGGAGGGSDNLGNHIATQTLNMNGNTVSGLATMSFQSTWSIASTETGSMAVYRNGVAKFAFSNSGKVGTGYVSYGDYGSLRASDATTFAVDNISYFAPNGSVLKAPLSAVNVADFAGIDHTTAPNLGEVLSWNGVEYAPAVVAGGTGITTIAAATDVNVIGLADGQYLRWDAANTEFTAQSPDFDGKFVSLTEVVAAAAPVIGEVWSFTATGWQPSAPALKSMNDLTDVNTAGLVDGDVLQWSSGSTTFTPKRVLPTDFDTNAPVLGDLFYFTALNVWSRIPAGANGQVLTMVGGVPAWA